MALELEIGSGFSIAEKGSEVNDIILSKKLKSKFKTNNAGGILGGITNGNVSSLDRIETNFLYIQTAGFDKFKR